MRTIIDIPDDQVEELARLGRRERVSRAELIRRAIAAFLRRHDTPEDDHAFGLWRDRRRDGLAYEDDLRRDWPS